MMKRVFIVHGWSGFPNEGWFPWLSNELKNLGCDVFVLSMPHPNEPTIDDWVEFLRKNVGIVDRNTYLVGHSIGCQTILRYLEGSGKSEKVGGVVLVAGWVHLLPLALEEEGSLSIAKEWLKTPLDWNAIKSHSVSFSYIASSDDYFVPLSDCDIFKEKLGAKVLVVEKGGHFSGSDNIVMLPEALSELKRMMNNILK
jgi:predicted alpha/beta hydrolase family esterase